MGDYLHFYYDMKLEFSCMVSKHYFKNIIEPKSTLRQKIVHLHYDITPCDMLGNNQDGFGNQIIYGNCFKPHDSFEIKMEGLAETKQDAKEEKEKENSRIFLYPSEYTKPGKHLYEFFNSLMSADKERFSTYTACEIAEYLMTKLQTVFSYQSGTSSVNSVAEEVFLQGCGVCQDYAHILITLLRLASVPARYVVGLIQGEGESHAWVEVLQDGFWYGIDPTNGTWVNENYIKISSGRDYQDCCISKGMFEGVANQKLSISVSVVRERKT